MNLADNEKLELDNEQQETTKESVLVAVRKCKLRLGDLPLKFRNDKDIVLAAVEHDIYALSIASKELQNDRDIVLAAVKKHCANLEYASSELHMDREIVLEAIKLGEPSFIGKANDEKILSRSLEAISNHLSLFRPNDFNSSNDLNFLYVSKNNFPIMEREVESMGWYKKIFSDEAKHLRMMRKLYRKRIAIFVERIRVDDKYRKEQIPLSLEEVRRKEEYKSYIVLRAEIEKMPIYEGWRKDVIKKCESICQMCGYCENLEVHHRISMHSILKGYNINSVERAIDCKQLWDVNNGVLLCKECHDKMESSKNRQVIMSVK